MSDKELEPPSRLEGLGVKASAGGWAGLRNPRWIGLLCEAAAETILGDLHAKHAPPSFTFKMYNNDKKRYYNDIYNDKIPKKMKETRMVYDGGKKSDSHYSRKWK